jgi:hypothetical protein
MVPFPILKGKGVHFELAVKREASYSQ